MVNNGKVIIFSIVSCIFIAIGILISKYKCYWLISGYNTASKEEKSKVDNDVYINYKDDKETLASFKILK